MSLLEKTIYYTLLALLLILIHAWRLGLWLFDEVYAYAYREKRRP